MMPTLFIVAHSPLSLPMIAAKANPHAGLRAQNRTQDRPGVQ
jgi:hypothetical protein